MTWLWRISFDEAPAAAAWCMFRRTIAGLLLAAPGLCGTITGSVSLSHSHVPAVQKGRDFSGVVVWLDPLGPAARIPSRAMRLTMEQKDKRFTPHVLAAQVGATVAFPNRDPIFHSAFSNFSGQIFDLGLYPPKTSREVTFSRPGVVRIFCNIHPSMSAVIVVLRSPWFAVSGESGAFAIHEVPPGDYRLRLFHERATEETLSKLERRVTVGAGDLQLPVLDISESGYIQAPHKNKYGGDYPPITEDGAYPTGRK